MKLKFLFLTFFSLLAAAFCKGQVNVKDSALFAPMLKISYAVQAPGGDLKDRFGWNSNIGGDFSIKTKKNWLFSVSGYFIFGNRVKETGILDSIKNSGGYIIDAGGLYAEVRMSERGYNFMMKLGRVIPVLSPNPNSGFMISLGGGLLQHKIRIDDVSANTPQLADAYKKGYDRLTNGFALSQFIGYLYLGNTRLLNGFAGFEITEAFTQNRRSFNFDTMEKDTKKRVDILTGFRLGIIIPFYKKVPDQFYFH